ncbi:MAG TPA: helix-turn-helix transcriptional regulator [Mycobacteriales bacterium]|nr:helix-turn-helix transcriptional regulator [Mycobacteriales bacterium]
MSATPTIPAGYTRSLERRLDVTLFDRAGLALEPAAAAALVRAALSLADRHRAGAVVASAERTAAQRPGQPSLVAAARHARAVLDRDADLLIRASYDHADAWAQASAAEDAAVVLVETGDQDRALEQLTRAQAGYEAVNACRDVDRVRARMRALGVRRRHWAVVERPPFGPDSLTGTERRVVDLAVEGLTNRQIAEQMFLSPHTIAFHLRQVFRKLGISSRVQLARQTLELSVGVTHDATWHRVAQ